MHFSRVGGIWGTYSTHIYHIKHFRFGILITAMTSWSGKIIKLVKFKQKNTICEWYSCADKNLSVPVEWPIK